MTIERSAHCNECITKLFDAREAYDSLLDLRHRDGPGPWEVPDLAALVGAASATLRRTRHRVIDFELVVHWGEPTPVTLTDPLASDEFG